MTLIRLVRIQRVNELEEPQTARRHVQIPLWQWGEGNGAQAMGRRQWGAGNGAQAMGRRQFLPISVVQLKGKHC